MKRGYNEGTHAAGCRCFVCVRPTTSWNAGLRTGPQAWSAQRLAARTLSLSDPARGASFVEKCRANGRKSRQVVGSRSSCPEHYVRGFLDALGVDYVHQQALEGFAVDFYVPHMRLVFEYDGKFWHSDRVERDAERTARLEAAGYTVVRANEDTLAVVLRETFGATRKEAVAEE